MNKSVDWTKVPVDTKVLVSNDMEHWIRRRFAKYENGTVYTFVDGCDSWTADNIGEMYRCESWVFTKLARD